jgi:hypothetical protein
MIDLASVLRRSGDVRYRLLDGEAVVLRQRAGEVLVLNEVASRILELADGEAPVGAWVEALAADYEADRTTLERDVVAFAAELAGAEVLERVR